MTTRTVERRRDTRVAAAYPASILDERRRVLATGRTANISQCGVSVITRAREAFKPGRTVILELALPPLPSASRRRRSNRIVRYRARLVRVQALGQLAGIGLELGEKLG